MENSEENMGVNIGERVNLEKGLTHSKSEKGRNFVSSLECGCKMQLS